ncbi:hypothetical protein EJ110_NYTH24686 [Nymphaea thermarum]|nr:hypothetical protein EJ110_NYTH24686 [Nymphaea thermarum]
MVFFPLVEGFSTLHRVPRILFLCVRVSTWYQSPRGWNFFGDRGVSITRSRCCHRRRFRRRRRHRRVRRRYLFLLRRLTTLLSPPLRLRRRPCCRAVDLLPDVVPCSLSSSSAPSPFGSMLLPWCPPLSLVLLLFYRRPCPLSAWSEIMAASSSSTVNTNQTELGAYRSKNVLVQVITLHLTKENYFTWSAAMTMGIAGRGRIAYIDGRNPEPARTSGVWDTWFLEDNQVKTWIVNSVSADLQPLILRKKTARDMWVILEQMYGQKKTAIRTY